MILPYFFREILDAFCLDYLPEKHCPPAYGFRAEKSEENSPEKSEEKTTENQRKIRSGFLIDKAAEKGVIKSAWKNEKYDTDTDLTQDEIRELNRVGLSIAVATVVKECKVKNRLSNRAIVAAHHVTGRRDGYSKGTVDKIAAIVAPSTIGVKN